MIRKLTATACVFALLPFGAALAQQSGGGDNVISPAEQIVMFEEYDRRMADYDRRFADYEARFADYDRRLQLYEERLNAYPPEPATGVDVDRVRPAD